MKWSGRVVAAGAFLVVGLSMPAAQQPRDTPVPGAVGTGQIGGRVVVDDASARPVRRSTVTLSAPEIRGTRTASTDDAGRFAFSGLPPGRYSLSAQKPGYVRAQYGAARIGQASAEPLQLAAGQQLIDLTIKLPRGAVVTGMVLDGRGRPVSGIRVSLLQYRFINGERVLGLPPAAGVGPGNMTDDRGTYRIYGLSPGEYVIAAQPVNASINEVRPITEADIQWAQRQVQAAASGSALGGAAPIVATPAPTPAPAITYSPMYYPGTADPRTAIAVKLGPGEERGGIDFSVPFVRTARISGAVVDPNGRPVREVQINVRPDGLPQGMGSTIAVRTVPDGTFTAFAMPPGHYVVSARTNLVPPGVPPPPPPPPGVPAAPAPLVLVPRDASANDSMWAMTDVDVDGNDLSGITLTLQPAMTSSARVTFESAAGAAPPPESVRLMLVAAAPSQSFPVGTSAASAQPDGSYLFKNLVPATYRLNGNVLPGRGASPGAGWMMKSVALNGRPVTDLPITIRPGDQLAFTVTFSDRLSEISGRLLNAAGQPASGYAIVIFTADQTYWGMQTRRTLQLRPDGTGAFRAANLPPGDYYMAAVTGIDATDLADPSFFDQLIPASFKVTLAEGEKKVQDLKLAGG